MRANENAGTTSLRAGVRSFMLGVGKKWAIGILSCPLLLGVISPPVQAEYYPGYTLYTPQNSSHTYLINQQNQTVHSWQHETNGGYAVYLLQNGDVLRTAQVINPYFGGGGGQGKVEQYTWDGNLVWEFTYSSNLVYSHHDIEPIPNGNVLMIAWEFKTPAEAQQAGFAQYSQLWPDHIIEVQPTGGQSGTIVWEWHAWDHLVQDHNAVYDNYGVVGDHPELIDINTPGMVPGPGGGDWMHMNGISYNPDLDQIVFSSHHFDEIYVIDHSTTTEEAAGHSGGNSGKGGDILYRWGKPSNYDAPGAANFNVVHCSIWIAAGLPGAGNIMAFNNNEGGGQSHVVELVPPMNEFGQYILEEGQAYGPDEPIWEYSAPGFYANHLGSCQRLPNNNTLMCESTSGYMLEVNEAGQTQWSYDLPGEVVRVLRYGVEYPGVYPLNPVDQGTLALNEIQIINISTVSDPSGEYDPWLEIRNNSNNEQPVWGFSLSTDEAVDNMWSLPDTTIAPNGYLVIWLDGDTNQPGLHAGFEAQDHGSVFLFAPDGTLLDEISSEFAADDLSYGRYPDGTGDFQMMFPTFGGENDGTEVLVEEADLRLPLDSGLRDCYPNPFNASITISYQLPSSEHVQVAIFNTLGQRIAELINTTQAAGTHSVTWTGTETNGLHAASGVYLVSFRSGNDVDMQKIVLLK